MDSYSARTLTATLVILASAAVIVRAWSTAGAEQPSSGSRSRKSKNRALKSKDSPAGMFTRGEKSSNSRGTRRISRLTIHLEQNRRGQGATICHRIGQYRQHLFYELSSAGTLVLHFASIVPGKYPILIVHLYRHWLHSRLSKHTSMAEKNLDMTRTRSPWHYARRLSVCNERPDLSC